MSIRSTAKAIVIKDEQILLNYCEDEKNGTYFSLPGGGQNDFETLAEAVVRECLEETGYLVKPVEIVALCEEICMDMEFRKKYPAYAHKMYHIFRCELSNGESMKPYKRDDMQVNSEWINLGTLHNIKLLPLAIGTNIFKIIEGNGPVFLGSDHIIFNHA
jgi:8-oxo-dGTP diphosphatase